MGTPPARPACWFEFGTPDPLPKNKLWMEPSSVGWPTLFLVLSQPISGRGWLGYLKSRSEPTDSYGTSTSGPQRGTPATPGQPPQRATRPRRRNKTFCHEMHRIDPQRRSTFTFVREPLQRPGDLGWRMEKNIYFSVFFVCVVFIGFHNMF